MELILLFALPLVVGLGGETEIPKVLVAEVVIATLLVISILKSKFELSRNWFLLFAALFVGINSGQWLGNGFRLQGAFLQIGMLMWAMLAVKPVKIPPWVSWSLLLVLVGLSLIIDPTGGRAVATLGEPNALAATAVFAWAWGGLGALLPAVVVIWLSGSRSGLIAVGLQILLFIFIKSKFKKHTLAAAMVIFVASLLLPWFDDNRIWENRVDIWQTAWSAGLERPILGWGFGNLTFALNQTALRTGNIVQYQTVDSAHNLLLDWWVQGGIVGLGILTFLIIQGFVVFNKQHETNKFIALFGILVCLSFNPASIVSLVHFWWFVGQGFDTAIIRSSDKRT